MLQTSLKRRWSAASLSSSTSLTEADLKAREDAVKLPCRKHKAEKVLEKEKADMPMQIVAASGALQGRPSLVHAFEVACSNRRIHGAKRRRHEITAAEKLHMCSTLERLMEEHGHPATVRESACRMFGLPWRILRTILERKNFWSWCWYSRWLSGLGGNRQGAADE